MILLATIWALLEALLEAVMRIHKIPTFQADQQIPPEEQRRDWQKEGARPKNPWEYQPIPHDDKDDIPMSEFPEEKSGLPKQKGSAETSFTDSEGNLD